MAPAPLSVRSPDPAADAAELVELVAMTFGNYFAVRREALDFYLLHSHYDWEASAVGRVGAQLATHWGVWDYQMRIGGAVVRCGGIGAVATHADHRRKGHMARTAPHAIARMKARGYHLSILFGIDGFYHRFGYVPAWPESRWTVLRKDLPAGGPTPRLVRVPRAPRPDVDRLHNRWNEGLTGTAVRPTYTRGCFITRPGLESWLWTDGRGRAAGLLTVHEDGPALVCTEALGEPRAALAGLRRLAGRKNRSELRLETLPYGAAVVRAVRALNCRHEQRYARDGEAMVRVIDLAGCLRAMEGELSRRLAASPLSGWRGALLIRGPEGAATLALAGGRVRVGPPAPSRSVVRGGFRLAQLLLGTDDPLEACAQGGIRLTGDAARLVPVLFPAQHPQLQLADRY